MRKEKNGLDRNVNNSMFFCEEVKESKSRKIEREKIEAFNRNAVKCEEFCFKPDELKSKIYWCNAANCSCNYFKCPKREVHN